MGPASLPTPLSPMRGPAETGAWHPAVSQPRTEARERVRRRRSHRHPGTPSCHLARPLRANPFADHAGKRSTGISATGLSCWPETFGTSARIKDPPRCLAGIRPVGPIRSDAPCACPSSTAASADRSPCMRQSRDKRGQASPRLSGSNLSSYFRPLGHQFPGNSAPFRWIETAPAVPDRQALQARLIHRRPFSLWTRVDKSTLRRKRRRCET